MKIELTPDQILFLQELCRSEIAVRISSLGEDERNRLADACNDAFSKAVELLTRVWDMDRKYDLSKNQRLFVTDAFEQGFDVSMLRVIGTLGLLSPAVTMEAAKTFFTNAEIIREELSGGVIRFYASH